MAVPPVPSASTPVPPPLTKLPMVVPGTGMGTLMFVSFLTELWAGVNGDGGLSPTITTLMAQVAVLQAKVATLISDVAMLFADVAVIFGMHGDGTLDPAGLLTVTKTNGVPFVASATTDTTDADNITSGTLPVARLAANSVPYAKLVNTAGAALLGATAAGPVVEITLGAGIVFVAGAIVDEATIVTTVAGLPAQPYPQGRRRFVSDALLPTFGAAVAGAGAVPVPVYSTGAAWNVG